MLPAGVLVLTESKIQTGTPGEATLTRNLRELATFFTESSAKLLSKYTRVFTVTIATRETTKVTYRE